MSRITLLLTGLIFSATAAASDADGDGWATPSDCDDNNVAIHPGATDICNDVDDDCDGVVDQNEVTWYVDRDGDGYGTSLGSIRACPGDALPPLSPGSWSLLTGDCFDTNANMSPGLEEVCDGLDNDCDGQINNGIPVHVWHADLDGDGHGSSAEADQLAAPCPPAMYVISADDCDDAAASVYTGAAETCDDLDNDCDDEVDEGLATKRWYVDEDHDGYGDDLSAVDACERPARGMLVGGDCDDSTETVFPGAEELCDGVDNDCDGLADGPGASDAETWAADADGDGYGDPAQTVIACVPPESWVAALPADCDDADPDVGLTCPPPPVATSCSHGAPAPGTWAALALLTLWRRRSRSART